MVAGIFVVSSSFALAFRTTIVVVVVMGNRLPRNIERNLLLYFFKVASLSETKRLLSFY